MLRTPEAASVPTSEPVRMRAAHGRTTLLRLSLAAGICVLLALAFVVARAEDEREAPLVPTGTTGMLVLDLSASVFEGALDETVAKLVETDERIGLVVFSDAGYELLPPGSPSRELASLLRFFRARPDATLPPNPWDTFRGGTRISSGIEAARTALLRENVREGSLVLVSDLEILPDEVTRVARSLARVREDGFAIRIVPISPNEEKRALVEQLTGSGVFASEPGTGGGVRTAEERSLVPPIPWLFVFVSGLLVVLVTANEWALPRLVERR